MTWIQLTKDDEPVLIDFAKVTFLAPARGILGKGNKCSLHFAASDSMGGTASITVEESYDDVAAQLYAIINAPDKTA
jgi:penicillin V acylase-like amidase (Ntn superfamily)